MRQKRRPRRLDLPLPGRDPLPRLRSQRRNALRAWAEARLDRPAAREVLRILEAIPGSVDARAPRQEARTLAQLWGAVAQLDFTEGPSGPR